MEYDDRYEKARAFDLAIERVQKGASYEDAFYLAYNTFLSRKAELIAYGTTIIDDLFSLEREGKITMGECLDEVFKLMEERKS